MHEGNDDTLSIYDTPDHVEVPAVTDDELPVYGCVSVLLIGVCVLAGIAIVAATIVWAMGAQRP